MSIKTLDFAEPFFTVKYLVDEQECQVGESSILVNIAKQPIEIQNQKLAIFQSVVVTNTAVSNVKKGILVERFSSYEDEEDLFMEVKKAWPLAYDIRKEERLKGVSHFLSPKVNLDNVRLSMYHSGSVPLNVGLHKEHVHCGDVLLKEVHTQIVGFGKMQQCLEKDVGTLYLEEPMAPGMTHKPMFDENGNYPWHQYETITPAIFMAIEVLPADHHDFG